MRDILIAKNIKKYFLFQPDWLSQFFKVKEGQPSYIKAVDNVSFTVSKTIIRPHEPTAGQALVMCKDIFTMSKLFKHGLLQYLKIDFRHYRPKKSQRKYRLRFFDCRVIAKCWLRSGLYFEISLCIERR